jgi:Alpha-kinase family
LLDLVYKFISEDGQSPFHIPKFRFVESALAMESSLDDGKKNNAVFLVEEVIAEENQGPFRKYLNNVSPIPLMMTSKEDEERAMFLAFSQHVQYWKTKKQVFVSDYQGNKISITLRLRLMHAHQVGIPC